MQTRFLIFKNEKSEPLAMLLIQSTDRWNSFAASPYLLEFEKIFSRLIEMVRKMVSLVTREKNYRQLFSVTELFNSTMDSQVILNGIMDAISKSFPLFKAELLLSHDQNELSHSFKIFNYMNERQSAIDAFVSGELTIEEGTDLSNKLINAPIKGRQGIYGVLQINIPSDFVISSTQKNFIRMLANTAGNALENASLYDQSHRLIEDLQLVNETSRKLNSNLQFDEMISYLKQQLEKAFNPNEIAFVFSSDDGAYTVSTMSSSFFHTATGLDYVEYTSQYLKKGKESLFDANFSSTVKMPVHFESVIAIPITNQEQIAGFVICLHQNKYFFSFDSFKLMRSLISHSSLALANSLLRDQLQELVDKDYLTKLYTRSYLDIVVEKSLQHDQKGVLILIDVDNFKQVNDLYGHEVGDDVLKQISSYILTKVAGKGIAARWGGEELAIYLPSIQLKDGENLPNYS